MSLERACDRGCEEIELRIDIEIILESFELVVLLSCWLFLKQGQPPLCLDNLLLLGGVDPPMGCCCVGGLTPPCAAALGGYPHGH